MNNRPLSIQEILKHVFNNQTGKLKATLNSSQDYLNAVYDPVKDAIRINLDGGSGSGGSILIQVDNETIEKNDSGEIRAIGIKETNLGSTCKLWVGTLDQYTEQNKAQSNDICIITDDNVPLMLNVVDSVLDDQSTNPVQNKVITEELQKKVDKGNFDELEEVTSWQIVE